MGGKTPHMRTGSNLARVEDRIKSRINPPETRGGRHVFLSFDHGDLDDVRLLRGQAKNPGTDLQFSDHSVKEPFNSDNADYIKREIRKKIDQCSVTAVYLTGETASSDWVDWEIRESQRRGKGVIGV